MAVNNNKEKPVSLASMVAEIKQLRQKVETRNSGQDDISKKQKERMDAIKKRINEDVRNDSNAGGRRMPNAPQQQSKSSAQQTEKKSPAITGPQGETKSEQNNFNTSKMTRNMGDTDRGKNIAQRYMDNEDKKKKGGSAVVGS
jgi:hypothetical protein